MSAPLESIGLGGDGDEVDAIARVEERFGVAFDIEDCARFVTVGDVWRALLAALGASEADPAGLWPDFVRALGEESLAGDEYDSVGLETALLGPPFVEVLKRAARRLFRR